MFALLFIIFTIGLTPLALSLPIPVSQRDSTPKYVVTHFMVGNAFPYTLDDWLNDIKLASANHIDAFVLNIGSDSWQPARVNDAYTAAQQSGTGFKMLISFDMTAMPCASSADADALRQYVTKYSNHPAQLMYNGKALFSTFSGNTCLFGTGSTSDGWSTVFNGANVAFVPSFFTDPSQFGSIGGILDGMVNWNSGWPIDLKASDLPSNLAHATDVPSTDLPQPIDSMTSDDQYLVGLGLPPTTQDPAQNGKIYMPAVSPWFYTHYGANSYNKNWIYLSDDHLYAKRWENLVTKRDHIPIVQIISWNGSSLSLSYPGSYLQLHLDFGESHYIGPIEGAQPNSEAWVDGFDHQAWLTLTRYYAQAFKTGAYPTPLDDKVVIWARPHSKLATSSDPVGKPRDWELVSDSLWAWVLLKDPATVVLSTSPCNSRTFNMAAGLNKVSIPLAPGGPLSAEVTRNGQQVLSVQSQNYTYQETNVPTYNFNAFVVESNPGVPAF
ncbi:glycoside hydrolase family 71 protein [Cantharellus anzutake]|uniref:glycoside hydrolase family 71 protein n=1 Tax=Cantharellus anzutake TaxID=1750568 RepID=UPI0019066CAC|nr:glycoside hydrolase family 71 protein [Cantharellus anzutake]KAF8334986.1 glycoside hydrolase family 71 protein [Cantharellus anzutake]